jgi:hypothetical protein
MLNYFSIISSRLLKVEVSRYQLPYLMIFAIMMPDCQIFTLSDEISLCFSFLEGT